MKYNKHIQFLVILFLLSTSCLGANSNNLHPNLVLTSTDVDIILDGLKEAPLFEKSLNSVKEKIDKALNNGIDVPIPLHAGGGYTHEKHKQNYTEMHQAGILFQFTKDAKYKKFIKNMLDEYALLYPTLGTHPQGKKQTPGRLFWQTLNETVWLLHTIQAYDCIYNDLSKEDRNKYESKIFNPMVQFFINDCRHKFNSIHNHGTWMVSAVGMTGFVLNNKDYVSKALYGLDESGKSGYLAQLKNLFSPDGYYTEGGYYARYALWPFFIFAESINNNLPELEIYKYRNSILKKALESLLQVTYTNGEFIPINDAIKEKTWLTPELIYPINFIYANAGNNSQLLNLVSLHNRVSLNGSGFKVAQDLLKFKNLVPFEWKSVEFSDGPNGDRGGVSILRYGTSNDQSAVLFKYGSHGLSHGHFDKLSMIYYDQGREIIPDYGAARFLNIEQKYGGRYLPENNTYSKQTIAHNTLVVDEKSQFDGKMKKSEEHHSIKYAVDFSDPNFQYTSAIEKNAYDMQMHRTICLINDNSLSKPIIVDIFKVTSDKEHQYDLPFYYKGHFVSVNFEYDAFTTSLSPLGKDNGYQHLWKEAYGKPNGQMKFTWINGERFYSITSNTNKNSKVYFTRIGANDPNFNLRNETGFIIRQNTKSYCFASVIEPHGSFDPISERTSGAYSNIKGIEVLESNNDFTVVKISYNNESSWLIFIKNNNPDKMTNHQIKINNNSYNWTGPVSALKL